MGGAKSLASSFSFLKGKIPNLLGTHINFGYG
jgi:hypothetical protein